MLYGSYVCSSMITCVTKTSSDLSRSPLLPALITVGSGLSLYTGAAIAVGLFAVLPPAIVAWLRVAFAGAIMAVLFRPSWDTFFGDKITLAAAYGASMIFMNICFYNAIESIPLGTAVAIEFVGPIVVGALTSKTLKHAAALVLAAVGVLLISGVQWTDNAVGVLYALGAAAGWGVYIWVGLKLSRRVESHKQTQKLLAAGLLYGAFFALPVVWWVFPDKVAMDPAMVVGLAAGLAVLSTVVPSSLDIIAMRLSTPSLYAVLSALMPLVATVCGAVILGQFLTVVEMVGVVAVIVAVLVRR
ncbi:EamA family transporter [Corynebacterium felinum]